MKSIWKLLWTAAFIISISIPAAAQAQESGKNAKLPWFVMTGRVALGGGGGSITYNWDAIDGFVSHKETVNIKSVNYFGVIPEAFFMPTQGRQFLISASLPMGAGNGTYATTDSADKVIDGEKFHYNSVFLTLGLGYQWYFGEMQRTNFILMSHLGVGTYGFSVDYAGKNYASDRLGASYFDISAGMTHRWANNILFGGTLDLSTIRFQGQAGDSDFMDVQVQGAHNMARLNAMIGYAFF